jgi:hypothetical protein
MDLQCEFFVGFNRRSEADAWPHRPDCTVSCWLWPDPIDRHAIIPSISRTVVLAHRAQAGQAYHASCAMWDPATYYIRGGVRMRVFSALLCSAHQRSTTYESGAKAKHAPPADRTDERSDGHDVRDASTSDLHACICQRTPATRCYCSRSTSRWSDGPVLS